MNSTPPNSSNTSTMPRVRVAVRRRVGIAEGFGFQITKFMVLELVVAVFDWRFSSRSAGGCQAVGRRGGRFGNLFEVFILFFRNKWSARRLDLTTPTGSCRLSSRCSSSFCFAIFWDFFRVLGRRRLRSARRPPLAFVTFLVGIGTGMKSTALFGFWTGFAADGLPPLLPSACWCRWSWF